jgi:TatD DNase family protein
MTLSDAHCHLQDPRLPEGIGLSAILTECRALGIQRWMVNATRESDWNAVTALAEREPGVHAAYGLHPWWQKERSPGWENRLEALLSAHPQATIGEAGLDRWMQDPDMGDQTRVLEVHLELSRALDRPITLHCLRAWPELAACLKRRPPSRRGFLLHSYSGPRTDIAHWVRAGAYFSMSPAFLHPRKARQREAFMDVPLERLLLETDAPDMAPPAEMRLAALPDELGKSKLNHPANLRLCMRALCEDRGLDEPTLALQIEENASRLFFWH